MELAKLKPLPPDPIPYPDLDNDAIILEMHRDLKRLSKIVDGLDLISLTLWERIWANAVVISHEFGENFGLTKDGVIRWLVGQIIKSVSR